MVKVNGGYLPVREDYEFNHNAKTMISYSSYYCASLIDNVASLIAKDYTKIKREVNSQSFDYALSKNLEFAHSELYLQFFKDFFEEGHLRSEALHLKRNFSSN